jgi:CRISPR-associated protein Cmr3
MIINITPTDTLLFRDGRPFESDGADIASGAFPPFPSVFYGTLRAKYLSENLPDMEKRNQPDDPSLLLKIRSLFLSRKTEPLYLIPRDCVRPKNSDSHKAEILQLAQDDGMSSNPLPMKFSSSSSKPVASVSGYFHFAEMTKYLNGTAESLSYLETRDIIQKEYKTGIGRSDATRSTEESKLYRQEMLRLQKDFGFLLDFEMLALPQDGILKLGAENKSAYYQAMSFNWLPEVNLVHEKRFKIVLQTPAIFKNGWLPSWIDPITYHADFGEKSLKLIAAAIGNYESIGGWDIKENRPKPMYRAVPAGSVYVLESSDILDEGFFEKLHGVCISDINPEQGLGLAFIGKVSSK